MVVTFNNNNKFMKTKILFFVVLLALAPTFSTVSYGQAALQRLAGGLLRKVVEKRNNTKALDVKNDLDVTNDSGKENNSTNSNDEVTLVVFGKAVDSEKATDLALRSAIEQAYGVFVSANTTILNDDLVKDEIVTISSGNIKSYKVLSDVKCEDGQEMVTVKATVCISKLISYAKSKGASTEFAGATFAQNMKMKELNKRNEAKALENLLTQVKFMLPSCYDLGLSDIGEPKESLNSPNCYELAMYVDFKPNANTKVLCDLFLNTLKSLSSEKPSRPSRDQGSVLQFLWHGELNEETQEYVRGRNTPQAELYSNGYNPYSFYLRNSHKVEERFWAQLRIVTTAFQYSFVITDNLGGKSYLEPKMAKPITPEDNPHCNGLVPYGLIKDIGNPYRVMYGNDFVYLCSQGNVVNFEEGFRMQIKLVIPKDDIAKYSKFDVSLRK